MSPKKAKSLFKSAANRSQSGIISISLRHYPKYLRYSVRGANALRKQKAQTLSGLLSLHPNRPGRLEAPPGIEPGMKVLQTSALPLGYGADVERETGLEPAPSALARRRSTK